MAVHIKASKLNPFIHLMLNGSLLFLWMLVTNHF